MNKIVNQNKMKNTEQKQKNKQAREAISTDRKRTNLLKEPEQRLIAFFVQRIPQWVTSNMLSGIGLFGNFTVGASFVLAFFFGPNFLLLGLLGLILNWFGDSLDGRMAYYRKKSRKWFGFSLDIIIDWIGITFIGAGVIIYIESYWDLLGYLFITLYGWEMVIALLRYKVVGSYSIDSGVFSPTELRVVIGLILIIEVLFNGSIKFAAGIACVILLILNIIDSRKLLQAADQKDKENCD